MANPDIENPYDKFSTYHNLVAYLVKGKKSEGFDDMIDFLCRSKIHFALTVNPTIYISHMKDFWNSASYSTEQGIPQIKAKVDGKDISVTGASIKKHLKLQDEGGANSYSQVDYMKTFVTIGYTGNQKEYTTEKALLGPPWNSAVPTDTDPTPSTSQPENTTSAILDRTLMQPTEGTQVQQIVTPALLAQLEHRPQLNTKAPGQDDVSSPNTTISEILIDLVVQVPAQVLHPRRFTLGVMIE
ncbi:hypothetical protein L1987_18468 [Smallanthus sonchifolius]|uniref:Uncharacterized protein n=1 Tax=Smallanthus sonchifolius TaxID=185202 RepID=A0ACB9J0V6_9ASTR|nr:hypothetical protein L1987_18468 [Smallanthus sonchifolius]